MTSRNAWLIASIATIAFGCSDDKSSQPAAAAPQEAPAAATAAAPAAPAASEEGAAMERARAAIVKYQLTSLAPDCVKLEVDATNADSYDMTVYEVHNQQCGGDPGTEPRLFGMQVSRTGTKVASDAKSEGGELQVLQE
jgi:hypothetical protein